MTQTTEVQQEAPVEEYEPPLIVRGSTAGANCIECPFSHMGKPKQPVVAEGPERPIWIIVGEGPGHNETIQGRPFVGQSGRMVTEALVRIRTRRESVWITNATLCVEGTTQVRLADGSLERIDSLVANRYDGLVQTVDANGRLTSARVTGWYRNPRGKREMRDVSFRWAQRAGANGRTHAVLTEDHPVLTPEGWYDAADVHGGLIATGDRAPAGRALQIAYGTLLGNGTLQKGSLIVRHAEDQRLYAVVKARALSRYGTSLFHQAARAGAQPQYGFRTDAGAWGHATRDLFYPNDSKRIPRQVLAVADELLFATWYLDDGYMQHRRGQQPLAEICGVAFPESDLRAASAVLRGRGFENNVRRGRIRFTAEGTARFSAAIAAFVPPTMDYKLRPEDRGKYDAETYAPAPVTPFFDRADSVCTSPRRKGEDTVVYCLEVEGTHNFITPGAVVHNCQPPSGATDVQKKEARRCCAPRLQRELAEFPGRPVAALGAIAAQGFCGEKFSITQMAGTMWEVDFDRTGPRAVIPTIHPAAILRGGTGGGGRAHTSDLGYWALLYDLQKVNLLARGVDIKFTDDIEYETEDPVRAEKLVEDMVRDIRIKREFACDTETYVDDPKKHSALQAAHAKLNAIGLATVDRAISVAWVILTQRAKRLISAVLSDGGITKWFHNGLYDIPVLNRHGFTVNGPIEDTLLMHHSAFPGLAHDLQRVTTQFHAITPWKAEYRHGQGTLDELLPYNARDTLATMRDAAPLTIAIKKSNAEKTYEVDKAMARAAARMHVEGVPIDREVNEQLRAGFRANIDRSRAELIGKVFEEKIFAVFKERLATEQSRRVRKHDPLDFDERWAKRLAELESPRKPFQFMLDSSDHVVAFLKACGVPLSIQTASGRVSTKKDILESFVHYPEVRALLTYRENAKLLNTFVERLFTREYSDKIVYGFADDNDRVHPRWSVHKITGRWSSEAPGSQNWPKADKKKGRPNLRSQVIAPPGRALVAFDAKQLEARIIALLSGDPFLLDIFHNDKDIHSEFARIVWPDFDTRPVDERKVLRDMIKRPEYGAFYGGAVDTLWKAVVRDYPNVTITMIGKMVATMKTKMPAVTAWHQRMMRTANEVGEVRSALLGRRRCFPLKQFDLSEVINFPVQSTGADIINLGLMDIMPRLPENAFPILQIHDAVVFECDEDDAELVKQLVVTSFTREVTHEGVTINFPVDARSGKSWAEVN